MSVVRWGMDDSDVYVIGVSLEKGLWQCVGCRNAISLPTDRMVNHLKAHIVKGHCVPDYVIPELLDEEAP